VVSIEVVEEEVGVDADMVELRRKEVPKRYEWSIRGERQVSMKKLTSFHWTTKKSNVNY
jgi:hypothetical protein